MMVCGASDLCADHGWPSTWFELKQSLYAAAEASPLRVELSIDRLQLPAWRNGRRASPRGRGAFLHGQTPPLACWAIFLREHLPGRVQGSLFPAWCPSYSSLRSSGNSLHQVVYVVFRHSRLSFRSQPGDFLAEACIHLGRPDSPG